MNRKTQPQEKSLRPPRLRANPVPIRAPYWVRLPRPYTPLYPATPPKTRYPPTPDTSLFHELPLKQPSLPPPANFPLASSTSLSVGHSSLSLSRSIDPISPNRPVPHPVNPVKKLSPGFHGISRP